MLSVEQKGNFGLDGFHNAPEKYGYYCFNKKYVEPFLYCWKEGFPDRYTTNIVGGYIWIHLEPPMNLIIERCNSWYKIRAEEYHKIFIKHYPLNVLSNRVSCGLKCSFDGLEIFCTEETKLSLVKKCFNKELTRKTEVVE